VHPNQYLKERLSPGEVSASSNMFEFLRTSTLYTHKKTDLIKGHKYRQGDFIIKVGSFTVGHTTSATGATQQPYPKLFFV
jgi:hypothetical protein